MRIQAETRLGCWVTSQQSCTEVQGSCGKIYIQGNDKKCLGNQVSVAIIVCYITDAFHGRFGGQHE